MSPPDERPSVATWLRELRRAAAWHRRLLVAGLLAASVAFAIQALSPQPPHGVAVLVATRNISGGMQLSPADVQLRDVPQSVVPDGALRREDDVAGRTLVAPLRAGEVVTDVRVVGRSYLEAYGAELVAAPVRIADAASVQLLHAGDVIDVLAAGAQAEGTSAGGARLVASAVQVITIPRSKGSLLGSADVGDSALLVLATTSATAARLAAAAVTERLSVVIRPG
ncbi:MAG: pilus assembly protein CpaB [Actinomycetota bacterium]|nr:pilus assembly protein CpaB [Actinomycetota bacterium]